MMAAAGGKAAAKGGVGRQIFDWVERVNAEGLEGLVRRKAPGSSPNFDVAQRDELARVVERGPNPAVDGVIRWGLLDLVTWVWEEFRISLSDATMSRKMKALAFAKLSARPRHYAQNGERAAVLEKTSPIAWRRSETVSRRIRRGTRPSAPKDQRTKSAYIFGAICPKKGKGAGLVMPWCDTAAMTAHLAEISVMVAPGAHAILILDQAGWHMSKALVSPENITLLPLPPRSPELNPAEYVWQYIRENWVSNRIFESYDDIVDHCCEAWNELIECPWKIMTIGMRDRAHGC
jgi:transposase